MWKTRNLFVNHMTCDLISNYIEIIDIINIKHLLVTDECQLIMPQRGKFIR